MNNFDENFGKLPSTNYLKSSTANNQNLSNANFNNFNINNYNSINNNPSLSGNLGLALNTSTLQAEKDIRKIIEREIEPFIYSAKNELRLNIENFSKEISEYKHFESELKSVKEIVYENKRLILINQEENDRKINDSIYKFKAISNQFENLKENMFDFSKKMKNFEKIYEDFQEKFFSLDDLKQKFSQWENLSEKIYKQIEDQFADKFNTRIKNLENHYESSKAQIIENGVNLNNMNYEVKSLTKQMNDISKIEQDNVNLIKELKEKFTFFNSNNDGKFEELKKIMDSYAENTRINLKNINEEIEQYKNLAENNNNLSGFNSTRNSQNEKIETMNSNLIEIKLKLDKLTSKFTNMDSQIEEVSSDVRAIKIDFDVMKKNIMINEIDLKEIDEKSNKRFANKIDFEREINEIKTSTTQKLLLVKK